MKDHFLSGLFLLYICGMMNTNTIYSKVIFALIRVTIGSIFIFSGFIKLYPIEPFEFTFVENGLATWAVAPFLARILICIEIFLGLMFVCNLKSKITLKASLALLLFFTVYLIYAIATEGNDRNCGCFGTFLEMTPIQAIVKNILMMGMILLLFKNKSEWNWKPLLLVLIIGLFSIITPFILNPIDIANSENTNSTTVSYPLDIELLGDYKFGDEKPDLKKGKYLLSFLSVACGHCKTAGLKLSIINKKIKLPPSYIVLFGPEKYKKDFFDYTKLTFPYYYYPDEKIFKIIGYSFPIILYVEDGIIKKKWNGATLNQAEIEKAINE